MVCYLMLAVPNDPTRLNLSAITSSASELVLLFVDHITTSLIGIFVFYLVLFRCYRAVELPYGLPYYAICILVLP